MLGKQSRNLIPGSLFSSSSAVDVKAAPPASHFPLTNDVGYNFRNPSVAADAQISLFLQIPCSI